VTYILSPKAKIKGKPPCYVILPYSVLLKPPIRGRGREYLTPFEFAIATGLVGTARLALEERQHKQRLKAGRRAMERERALAEQFREDWKLVKAARARGEHAEAPQRHTEATLDEMWENGPISLDDLYGKHGLIWQEHNRRKPTRLDVALKRAGKLGYAKKKKALRKQSTERVTIEMSRYKLLQAAGLSDGSMNLRKVDAALQRLTRTVADRPPVLVAWEALPSGRLRLQVSGAWLPTRAFGRVPILPMKSAPALALWLFLHAIPTSRHDGKTMGLPWLCRILGITTKKGPIARRALHRALDAVNKNLIKLDPDALLHHKIKVPQRYEIQGADGGLRFVSVPHQAQDPDAPERIVLAPKKPKPKPVAADDFSRLQPSLNGFKATADDRRRKEKRWHDLQGALENAESPEEYKAIRAEIKALEEQLEG
jgi:hypothetical protein